MKILVGRLRQISCGETWFEDLDGVVEANVVAHPDCPLELPVEAVFENGVMVRFTVLVAASKPIHRKINMALVTMVREQFDTPLRRKRTKDAANDIEAELRRLGYLDFTCHDFVMVSDVSPNISGPQWPDVRRFVGPEYSHYHVWGGSHPAACGHAYLNWIYAITYSNCGTKTKIHETYHMVPPGLGHAGSPGNVYGDRWTWMGSGGARVSLNAPHLIEIGRIEMKDVYQLDPQSAASVLLLEPDTDPRCLRNKEFLAAEVKRTFSDKWIVGMLRGRVCVYSGHGSVYRTTTLLAELLPGREYNVDGEFYLKFVDIQEGVARIDLRWDKDMSAATQRPFTEYIVSEGLPWTEDVSGLWAIDNAMHQGLELLIRKGFANQAYWYGADRTGRREWYLIDGQTIYSTADGRLDKVGEANVIRMAHDKARMDVVLRERRFVFYLTFFAPHNKKNGIYHFVGQSHEGMTMGMYPQIGPDGPLPDAQVGYVYTRGEWNIIMDGRLWKIDNIRRGIKSRTELIDLGPVTFNESRVDLPGNVSYKLERIA